MDTAGSPPPFSAHSAAEAETGPGFLSPAELLLAGPLVASSATFEVVVVAEPASVSAEPGSLELDRPTGLGEDEAAGPNEVVHATISRSRRTCATASSSV